MSYDSILVPTDGSEHATRATEHALSLASTFGADVHALGVVDIARLAGPFDAGGIDQGFIDRFREEAENDIKHVENQWSQPDRYHGEVREGPPSAEILNYVAEEDIDLVAMGTHGRSGIERFVLGSVTEHVLRASPVPVLATRAVEDEPPTLPYRKVMVPTDGSECADVAIDHALSIADATGATVHVVYVVDTNVYAVAPGVETPSDYIEHLEVDGEAVVEDVAEQARAAGVEVETAVVEGRPSAGITSYADENDVDVVVMGTHGRSGLERFLLGSTTERVIRGSDLAVIAVPQPDADE